MKQIALSIFSLLIVPAPVFSETVTLANVLDSTLEYHPKLTGAEAKRDKESGKQLSALGAFDAKLKSDSKTYAAGFYEGRFVDTYVTKPLQTQGIELYSGFRASDGNFPEYDGDLATTEDGEFRIGARIPLVRDRAIDEPRGEVAITTQEVEAAEWQIVSTRLELAANATAAYWEWIAKGLSVDVITDLVKVARVRNTQIEGQVEAGDKPRFDLVDNQRSVLKRESQLVKVKNELQKASLKLAFYYRDSDGSPIFLTKGTLLGKLPDPRVDEFQHFDEEALILEAYEQRPEMKVFGIRKIQVGTEIDVAENMFLPQIDLDVMAAEDFGPGKQSLDQGEIKVGFKIEVPLQYRKARGKLNAAQATRRNIEAQGRLMMDKIAIKVRKQVRSLKAALAKLNLASRELVAAKQLERGELIKFNQGDSNLIFVTYREQTAAEAAIKKIEASLEYQQLAAELRATLGRVWKQ